MSDAAHNEGQPQTPDTDEVMDPREAERLKRRARIGAIALTIRTIVHQVTVFLGTIVLARVLSPGDFGVFAIVQYALSFFAFFGDVGLGGALVRQKEEPTKEQLSSVFFVQIVLSVAVVAVVSIAASFLHLIWPDLPDAAPWLMRALAIDLVLTAFRIIPSVLMERHLEFTKLAIVEVVVSMSFYVVAIILAFLGFGIWSLAAGLIAQGVTGLVVILFLRPFWPSWVFDRRGLRPLLRFGLAVQAKSLIGLVNGAVTPVYAGAVLGAVSVGYINWAQTTAYFPLKVVEIMARVNFPLFARLQGDKKLFAETLGRSIQVCGVATFAMVALFLGIGPQLTHVVFTDKWMPAVPFLYIYATAISIGFLSPIVGAALDAAGRPEIFFKLAIGWTSLNWLVVLLATPRFGITGYVAGYVVHVVAGNIAVILVVRKILPGTPFWSRLRGPLAAAAIACLLVRFGLARWIGGWVTLVVAIALAAISFAVLLWLFDREAVRDALAFIVPKKQEAA